MLGFAIVDSRASGKVAVWLTSRVAPFGADHTNAVLVDFREDKEGLEKVRLLTRDRVVLLTAGSTTDGLPLESEPPTVASAAGDLATEVRRHQRRILSALREYAVRPYPKTGRIPKTPRKVTEPEFGRRPTEVDFQPMEDTPVGRALAAANYLRAVWSWWLRTDHERARRASRSDGELWMPEGLSEPEVAELPQDLARRLRVQPQV